MTNKKSFLTHEAARIVKNAGASRSSLLRQMKQADLGGDPSSSFEQSFASLAFSYVQEKAPSLSDYMIGFQLVDKNEDNTKAIGIFGFKIGDQWAYVPVFFLSGNLKGHELLYLKSQDSFVPLKENWVNYILAKKPHILGEPTPDNLRQLGVKDPNLAKLSRPPMNGKYSSYTPPKLAAWAVDAMPVIAKLATVSPSSIEKFAGLDSRLNLRSYFTDNLAAVKLAVDLGNKYPTLKQAMVETYGEGMLAEVLLDMRQKAAASFSTDVLKPVAKPVAVKKAGILSKEGAADEAPKVEIKTDEVITEHNDMSDEERQKLLRDGYLVRDNRTGDEVAVAYNTQLELTLVNPDSTGLYDLLTKPGTFERCLIIKDPKGGEDCTRQSTAISLEGDKKKFIFTYTSNLFVKQQEEAKSDYSTYDDWYEGLSDNKSLSVNGMYVAVAKNRQGTAVFEVLEDLGDDCYSVKWRDNVYETQPAYVSRPQERTYVPYDSKVSVIYFNQREGSSFKAINGKMYMPPDVKIITLTDPPKCKECDKYEQDCGCDKFRYPQALSNELLKPGNLADLQMQIMQKTSELKVWSDQNEVVINRKRMSKMAGLFHLIKDHNLREKQAKKIIKEAARTGAVRYRVKAADQYEATEGPASATFPNPEYSTYGFRYGHDVPAMEGPQEYFQNIQGLSAFNTDPTQYDPMNLVDPMAMQTAQQAQQSGQKDVFDTTMIASMLKAVRDDSMVDRYLGDLVKALDRIGRILFMFYWHNEEFTNRYGKQDLPELEDTLRNAFEINGDLVLYLKQKSIDNGLAGLDMRPDGGQQQ